MSDTKGDLLIVINTLRDEEIIKNETANKLVAAVIKQDKEVEQKLLETFSKDILNILEKAFPYKRDPSLVATLEYSDYHEQVYDGNG